MALGSNHQTTTTGATFIPELWSDEVIAGYKKNLVLGNLVTKINHAGKKGDTIHIPKPVRGSANAKSANTQVTKTLRKFRLFSLSVGSTLTMLVMLWHNK